LRTNFRGTILVVTDASFAPGRGAFMLDAAALETFVGAYLRSYGECFFDGDVIIASSGSRSIWLFHHEGAYATLSA
jgi:hypothetical protein